MAGVAGGSRRKECSGPGRPLEPIEGPLAGRLALVLHLGLESEEAGLKMAALVDRALARGGPHLEHQDGLVRPFSGLEKRTVGGGTGKYIVERRLAILRGFGYRAIGHAEPR